MTAFAVTIISPPGYVYSATFNEVAETLHHGLLAIGHDSIRTTQTNIAGRQHIILGCNLLHQYTPPLADNAVLYSLEQIEAGSQFFDERLFGYYRQYTLWDYSPTNVLAFKAQNIAVAQVLPIGYTPSLTRIDPMVEKDIDVLFVGAMNERRQRVIDQMQALGLNVAVGYRMYGAERDAAFARAKVILNHHYFEAKVLEMVRISYLLANRCVVLSESSSSPEADRELSEGVAFAAYDDLPAAAFALVHDDARRAQLSQKGFELIRQRPIETYLRAVLG